MLLLPILFLFETHISRHLPINFSIPFTNRNVVNAYASPSIYLIIIGIRQNLYGKTERTERGKAIRENVRHFMIEFSGTLAPRRVVSRNYLALGYQLAMVLHGEDYLQGNFPQLFSP